MAPGTLELFVILPCVPLALFFILRMVAPSTRRGGLRGFCFTLAFAFAVGGFLATREAVQATHSTYTGVVTRLYHTTGRARTDYLVLQVAPHSTMEFFSLYTGPRLVVGERVTVTALGDTPRLFDLTILDGPGAGLSVHYDQGAASDRAGIFVAIPFFLIGIATWFFPKPRAT